MMNELPYSLNYTVNNLSNLTFPFLKKQLFQTKLGYSK